MKLLPLLLLAALPLLAAAQGDPLKSAACGEAVAALQQARSQGGASEALRARASTACLGANPAPGRPARVLQAPIAVPPPVISVPTVPPPLPAATLPPPPVAIDRPATVTTCDATGCWADDGQHVQHLAPNGAGPRGLCVPQGGMVYCP